MLVKLITVCVVFVKVFNVAEDNKEYCWVSCPCISQACLTRSIVQVILLGGN
jgi:hypothetical protein